jgi:uracil-DNA glycosylase family 4
MSHFTAALDVVLARLEAGRAADGPAWRASRASLQRLLATPAPVPLAAPGPPPQTAGGQAVTEPSLSKAARLAQLRACPERLPCGLCPYGQGEHPHIVFGAGNIEAELMFVGEAPGAEEDAQGEPFVGRAGQLLNKMIATMGYQRSDVYISNVLKCRPDTPGQTSGNRAPTTAEMESCRPCLYAQIEIIAPRVIVALGATAMRGLLDAAEPIGKLRGQWHDFRGVPVMATYHPSYLLRNQAPAERRKVWEDLLEVKSRLGHDITERDRSYFLAKS